MDIDPTMLGWGTLPTPTSIYDFAYLVSPSPPTRAHVVLSGFHSHSDVPVWKRLINRPLSTIEEIYLVKAIFSDPDETEAAKRLHGQDAQAFVEVMDKVILPVLSQQMVQ